MALYMTVKKESMSWDECLSKHLKTASPDTERAGEIYKMAMLRPVFWSEKRFSKEFTSLVVKGYYEIIKELLTALLFANGFKSANHECLISFFREKHPELVYEMGIIYQLRKVRNNINYRGFFVRRDYSLNNKMEFEHIISILKKELESYLS